MLNSIISPSFDPKVPLQNLVSSAPLLRGTKVGGDDAPVVFLLDNAQPLGAKRAGITAGGMAQCFLG